VSYARIVLYRIAYHIVLTITKSFIKVHVMYMLNECCSKIVLLFQIKHKLHDRCVLYSETRIFVFDNLRIKLLSFIKM